MACYNSNVTTIQQDLMAEVIVAMGAMGTEEPFTATSIVKQVLQQASGPKIPIKCVGCSNLPK